MYAGNLAILGGGAWGRALATAAARAGTTTVLFSRRVAASDRRASQAAFDVTESLDELGARARLFVLAVPSNAVGAVARELAETLDGRHLVVHAVRGLEPETLRPLSEVLRRELPTRRIGALGGPVLESELREGKPSVLVAGSSYPDVCDAVAAAFGSPTTRVYRTNDLVGLELASALMGCLAVGVGYAQELGLGAGVVATLITRGVEEAARIAAAAGGRERTLLGLAGTGDLLASIAQDTRPEVRFGRALGEGSTLDVAAAAAELRVEARTLIPNVARWAAAHKISAPIFQALAERLTKPTASHDLVLKLMASPDTLLP